MIPEYNNTKLEPLFIISNKNSSLRSKFFPPFSRKLLKFTAQQQRKTILRTDTVGVGLELRILLQKLRHMMKSALLKGGQHFPKHRTHHEPLINPAMIWNPHKRIGRVPLPLGFQLRRPNSRLPLQMRLNPCYQLPPGPNLSICRRQQCSPSCLSIASQWHH